MKLNWLHITDLHRGMTPQKWLWPTLEKQFFNDLTLLHESNGPIDLIFFTGDFVQKGSASEYGYLNKTIQRLYQHLKKLGSEPSLLVVPGNHDLVRPKQTKPEVLLMADWENKKDVRDQFWTDKKSPYRRLVSSAFKNYMDWCINHPFPKLETKYGILPGDFSARFIKDGATLGIVGLNTTVLQLTPGDFLGKMALHPSQISELCGENFTDWFSSNTLSFLMTHHPPEWLNKESNEFLNAEISPAGRFAAHFFGHEHSGKVLKSSRGGALERREFQGNSLFGLETWGEKQERRHGYSFAQLEFVASAKNAALRVWPRKAEKHQSSHWHLVPDNSFTLYSDGGTPPDSVQLECPLSCIVKSPENTQGISVKTAFKVLVLSTNVDLGETRSAVVQYLNSALGVDAHGADSSEKEFSATFDLVILLQGCWWDSGRTAGSWVKVEQEKRVGYVVDPSAEWPSRKLVERDKQDEIDQFLAINNNLRTFQDPAELPELVGDVVSSAIALADRESGGGALGVASWERTYLSFRIPSWVGGRTVGRPHALEPDSGTELYRPDLYVPLNGTSSRWLWHRINHSTLHRLNIESREINRGEYEATAPLAKWISAPELPRVALVGAPGGGKTVFLTRIAAAFAHACIGRPRELEESLNIKNLRCNSGTAPVPVVLEATRIEKQNGQGAAALIGAMSEEFSQAGTTPSNSEIDSGLKEGRYILLIDALDEVSDTNRRLGVLDLLKGIAADDCYPKVRIVLTTRSARYTGSLAFGNEFELVDVSPLEWNQVEMFCGRWGQVRKKDQLYYTDLMLAVTGLAVQVEKEGKDEAMTSNPLMLTAICMVFERYQSLPDDRARLCSLLVDDLCRSRNSEDVEHSWRMSDANKRDLLERIALAMQEKREQSWSVSRAIEIATRGVPSTEPLRQQRATKHLHWAAEHTGLLRFQQPEKGEEEIRFWHRLFREFLAASRLSQEDTTVSKLVDGLWDDGYLLDPFWEDVIRLLARTLGTLEKAKSLGDKLTELSERNLLHRGRLLGLLAAGIIESRDLFPDVDGKSLTTSFASIFEEEGLSWPMRDRLIFLEGLGGLYPVNGDPRLATEKWITIPSGNIDIAAIEGGEARPFKVNSFELGFAPVTVQEFREFLDSKDCFCGANWVDSAMDMRMSSEAVNTLDWRKQLRHLNHPVVNVTYSDALAYCRWKTSMRKDGKIVRLPTIEEHFRAADEMGLTQEFCKNLFTESKEPVGNFESTLIGRCSPVGAFAPVGSLNIADFLGNVLEWVFYPDMELPIARRMQDHIHIPIPIWTGCHSRFLFNVDRGRNLVTALISTKTDFLGFRCILASSSDVPNNHLGMSLMNPPKVRRKHPYKKRKK